MKPCEMQSKVADAKNGNKNGCRCLFEVMGIDVVLLPVGTLRVACDDDL